MTAIKCSNTETKPIPMAARVKTWVCDQQLFGIAGSNPARDVEVCLL
jgi:hypothetical protein